MLNVDTRLLILFASWLSQSWAHTHTHTHVSESEHVACVKSQHEKLLVAIDILSTYTIAVLYYSILKCACCFIRTIALATSQLSGTCMLASASKHQQAQIVETCGRRPSKQCVSSFETMRLAATHANYNVNVRRTTDSLATRQLSIGFVCDLQTYADCSITREFQACRDQLIIASMNVALNHF